MNESINKVGIELLGQLKIHNNLNAMERCILLPALNQLPQQSYIPGGKVPCGVLLTFEEQHWERRVVRRVVCGPQCLANRREPYMVCVFHCTSPPQNILIFGWRWFWWKTPWSRAPRCFEFKKLLIVLLPYNTFCWSGLNGLPQAHQCTTDMHTFLFFSVG